MFDAKLVIYVCGKGKTYSIVQPKLSLTLTFVNNVEAHIVQCTSRIPPTCEREKQTKLLNK